MVRCTLHLYFPAGWELGEGVEADPETLRELGDRLRARCRQAADALAALALAGWVGRVARHEIVAEKPGDRAVGMLDFLRAGLDPVALGLEETGGPEGRPPSARQD